MTFCEYINSAQLLGSSSNSEYLSGLDLTFLQDADNVIGVEVVECENKLFVVKDSRWNGVFGVGAANVDYFVQLAFFTWYWLFVLLFAAASRRLFKIAFSNFLEMTTTAKICDQSIHKHTVA